MTQMESQTPGKLKMLNWAPSQPKARQNHPPKFATSGRRVCQNQVDKPPHPKIAGFLKKLTATATS